MKRLVFFICILFSINANCQNVIKNEIIVGESQCCGDNLQLKYELQGDLRKSYLLVCDNNQINIEMSESGVLQFSDEIKKMAAKYSKWAKQSKDADVRDFTKDLGVHISDKNVWFKVSSEWYNEEGVDFAAKFVVDSNGKPYAYIESDEMSQNSTNYVSTTRFGFLGPQANTYQNTEHHSNGFILLFDSPEQLENLSKMLSEGVVNKKDYVKKQKGSSKLFR